MKRRQPKPPAPAPLDPAVLQLVEALALGQAREDHERERRRQDEAANV